METKNHIREPRKNINQEMDRYYDIVLRYQRLSDLNRKTFRMRLERLD